MIRVAIVDDHYAVRLGLRTALETEHDMQPVGAASTAAELAPLLYRTRPHVVIVDYRLPDEDGLRVGQRLKREVPAPAVLLHSAFADDWLTIPAILAGIDGIVHKAAPGRELSQAVRTVAKGSKALPPVRPEFLSACSESLAPEDRPILAMLVHGTPEAEIAPILHLTGGELRLRMDQMIGALRVGAGGS